MATDPYVGTATDRETAPAARPSKLYTWVYSLGAGSATITAPDTITLAEVEDLEQMFRLIVRTLMRRTLADHEREPIDTSDASDFHEVGYGEEGSDVR